MLRAAQRVKRSGRPPPSFAFAFVRSEPQPHRRKLTCRHECPEKYGEGKSAEHAPNSMKPAPAPQKPNRLFRSPVELRALQPLVRREYRDEGKRNHEKRQQSANQPAHIAVEPPSEGRRQRPDQSERSLHKCSASVARPPLRDGRCATAGKPRRLLGNIDVNGCTEKRARRQRRHEFGNHDAVYVRALWHSLRSMLISPVHEKTPWRTPVRSRLEFRSACSQRRGRPHPRR